MLLLAAPSTTELRALAEKLTNGIVSALLPADDVYKGRRAVADCTNVMFTPADADAPIPWRDGFFSVVFAPGLEEISRDIERVLAPGGSAYLARKVVRKP